MPRASLLMAIQRKGEGAREFPRLSTMIPVYIEIAQTWQGTDGASVPGGVLNVSCGGTGMRRVLPPRGRLVISVPTDSGCRHLPAEVVWTSTVPGRRSSPGVYGLRWMERLSPRLLESLLPRMERIPEGEYEDGPAI